MNDETKCPFLYDSCMCSIPEDGEHCEMAFKFRDGLCRYKLVKFFQFGMQGPVLANDLVMLPKGER